MGGTVTSPAAVTGLSLPSTDVTPYMYTFLQVVDSMFTEFVEQFGRVDIVVNNPYYAQQVPFLEITEEGW